VSCMKPPNVNPIWRPNSRTSQKAAGTPMHRIPSAAATRKAGARTASDRLRPNASTAIATQRNGASA